MFLHIGRLDEGLSSSRPMPAPFVIQLIPEKFAVDASAIREDQLGIGEADPLSVREEALPAARSYCRQHHGWFVELVSGEIAINATGTIGWKAIRNEVVPGKPEPATLDNAAEVL